MELSRTEFAALIERVMCGATPEDERLTDAEREALAALKGARPSQRHDLIGAAWHVYSARDPEKKRREARREAAQHHHDD